MARRFRSPCRCRARLRPTQTLELLSDAAAEMTSRLRQASDTKPARKTNKIVFMVLVCSGVPEENIFPNLAV